MTEQADLPELGIEGKIECEPQRGGMQGVSVFAFLITTVPERRLNEGCVSKYRAVGRWYFAVFISGSVSGEVSGAGRG